jgi:3-dehydroquinate dehydratase / shikimate dehydrogenase
MTRLTVPIMVESQEQAHALAATGAEHGADMVEYRIDHFTEQKDSLAALVDASPLPCIITCRPTWEGGEYDGDESERASLFEAACSGEAKPAYLDIELAAWQKNTAFRKRVKQLIDHPGQVSPTTTGLILSSHDFEDRPTDLYQRIEAMAASPSCRVMKLAWRSRSMRDSLEAFEIIRQRHKPTIALCMGETGLASRVLAKKFGAFLTFASLDKSQGTAPGQPTLDEIKSLYRWDKLDPQTQVFGVIGWPVGHSISPAFHNSGFDAVDYNGIYLPMPIPPEYEHFKATVTTWLDANQSAGQTDALNFRGASVTIPHKENLMRFVEERGGQVEPLAKRIGAANTLTVNDDGSLHACNTDYAAAIDAVCAVLDFTDHSLNANNDAVQKNANEAKTILARNKLQGKRVAVIGAGGAARAIVAGFAYYGATVVIYNRTHEKAQALASVFNETKTQDGGQAKVVAARLEKLCDSCCHVFINCTPVGMHPNIDVTPVPDPNLFETAGQQTIVFDTVYNPRETQLLRDAKANGCTTIQGSEMFLRQGIAQFEQWTQMAAPIDVLTKVIEQSLL